MTSQHQQSDPYLPVIPGSPAPQSPHPAGPYPPSHYPPQQVVMVQGPSTSGIATAAMVLGVLGALGGWCLFAAPCILAVFFGHMGMSETKDGARGGRGMAVTGLILGYLFGLPWLLVAFWGSLVTLFG